MAITIGMASFDDHLGVWATVQSLRLHQAPCEIVLVDNNPAGKHGDMNASLFKQLEAGGQPCQYIPFDGVVGTSAPRDLVFRKARGEWVFVVDSHVELWPGAIAKLSEWTQRNAACNDLLTGPIVYDTLRSHCTHYNDVWQDGVWGVWALAWACPCGRHCTVTQRPPAQLGTPGARSLGECEYRSLVAQQTLTACPCGTAFPVLSWAGHEASLSHAGYRMLGEVDDEPFEIPACGLGLFGCRRDAWLGFNAKLRGWGGEEWGIHEKYRRAGRKCLSLPFLRWVHRFGNPYGHADERPAWDRIRNYVIWHHELGLPLERVKVGCKVTDEAWAQLMTNPANPPELAYGQKPKGCCPASDVQCESIIVQTASAITDLHQQAKLGELIEQCLGVAKLSQGPAVPVCDMLVIDACRTGACLSAAFVAHSVKVKRWLAILGMTTYWGRGEDGTYGLMPALSNFLHHEKRWRPIHWSIEGAGLVVLSCDTKDWPEEPIYFSDPGFGPGTELKELLTSLGIVSKPNCQCDSKAAEMNMRGVMWCRANRDAIVTFLKAGSESFGWSATLGAGWKAVTSGILWTIGISDPIGGLVDEAIRRAGEKRKARAAEARAVRG